MFHCPAPHAGLACALTFAESVIPAVSSASVNCPVPVVVVDPDRAPIWEAREPMTSETV